MRSQKHGWFETAVLRAVHLSLILLFFVCFVFTPYSEVSQQYCPSKRSYCSRRHITWSLCTRPCLEQHKTTVKMELQRSRIFSLLTLFILHTASADQGFAGYYPSVLVQRRHPLPGAPSKLHEINYEPSPSKQKNNQVDVDKIFKKFEKRSRRSINPDFSPKVVEVCWNNFMSTFDTTANWNNWLIKIGMLNTFFSCVAYIINFQALYKSYVRLEF